MPKLMQEGMEMERLAGGFQFSGATLERLGASEYTLVTIAVDVTGSVYGFADELRNCLMTAIESCQKSPRQENLLVRVIQFASRFERGVDEINGFQPLMEINTSDYPNFNPGGVTPLYDACYNSVAAMNAYGRKLADDGYAVNAIMFVITDGDDNTSTTTANMVREEMRKAVTGEDMESLVSVLIGINADEYRRELEGFQREAGFDKYIDAGEATKSKLAKLAEFVSQSVISQSLALVEGTSQNISATI